MIFNHIKLAFRQIGRYRFSFAIAIIGLAISLAAVGHLLSYSLYHLDYDRNVQNHEEWYRLRYSSVHPELGEMASASFFIPPASMLLRDIPEVKDHIVYWPSVVAVNLRCDGKPFLMEERVFVSANFLEHYKMEIIYGNPDSLLSDRNGILLSESFARSYFGDTNPVGKKIYVGENPRFYISGVFADLKSNLHLRHDQYSLWFNDDESSNIYEDDWYLTGHVRLRIPDKADAKIVEGKLNEMLEQHRSVIGTSGTLQVHLDPVSKIHFIPGLKDDAPTMSILNIYSILVLSFMLLLTALSNFFIIIGLSWKKRADEFYFRLAVGAGRAELFSQMICEYGLYFCLSVLMGIVIYAATRGIFESVAGLDIHSYSLFSLPYVVFGGLVLFTLGAVSGLIMSMRHSGLMLEQNSWHRIHRNRGITILLFVQMIISFAFIALAFSLTLHYSFIRNIDRGWDSKDTIQYKYLSINDEGRHGYIDARILRQRIREIPGVTKESVSNFNLASESLDDLNGFHEGPLYLSDSDMSTPIRAYVTSCMPDFFETREIMVVSGKIPDEVVDAQVVVNQCFADRFLPEPLGSKLRMGNNEEESRWYEVVAVVEDCWFFPSYHEMIPMFIMLKPYVIKYYQITWQEGSKQEVLPALDALFAETAANGVFGYSSREIELVQTAFYAREKTYKDISLFMAIFVVLIAVMGIYAVSSVSIHTQMKDISIRKICGAEFSDLMKYYFRKYFYLYAGSAIPGLYLAYKLIGLYAERLSLQSHTGFVIYPAALIIMALVIFIPLYLNIRKAFRADSTRYLQAD
jgi:putative ABC transport system permease protein